MSHRRYGPVPELNVLSRTVGLDGIHSRPHGNANDAATRVVVVLVVVDSNPVNGFNADTGTGLFHPDRYGGCHVIQDTGCHKDESSAVMQHDTQERQGGRPNVDAVKKGVSGAPYRKEARQSQGSKSQDGHDPHHVLDVVSAVTRGQVGVLAGRMLGAKARAGNGVERKEG